MSLVTTDEQVEEICLDLLGLGASQALAIDSETTGLRLWSGDVVRGVCLAYEDQGWYIPVSHPDSPNVSEAAARNLAQAIQHSPALHIWHNAIFDWTAMGQLGMAPRYDHFWDTAAVAWAMDENQSRRLKDMGAAIFGEDAKAEQTALKHLFKGRSAADCYKQLRGEGWPVQAAKLEAKDMAMASKKSWGTVTAEDIAEYAEKDARLTLRLYHWQQMKLALPTNTDCREDIPRQHAVLAMTDRMIRRGVLVDLEDVAAKRAKNLARIWEIEPMFEGINLNSPKQLGALVYDTWGLPCSHHTKTGARSTNREALEELSGAHESLDVLLEYRGLAKVVSTYYDTLLELADETGRIHAGLNPNGTATGRYSCVAADSLIEMPRDLTKHPDGIPITDVRQGDWVYSFDWRRELTLRRVKWVAQTGVKQTVVVTVQNSEGHKRVLRLTPEHLVRLRSGDWRPAGSLSRRGGDPRRTTPPRVMTMVRRGVDAGYVKFFPHSVAKSWGTTGGGKYREHRWVAEKVLGRRISTKTDVHHRDGNKANNRPDNLQPLTIAEHRGKQGHVHPMWGTHTAAPDIYCGPTDYRVVSVEPGPVEPVWDMEVEHDHSFIANGVVVHNCSSPNMQNIPREDTNPEVKKVFRAEPGMELWEFDLKSAELFVGACVSGDDDMLGALETEGRDFHTETAVALFGASDGTTRTTAKNLNYGIPYGIGPWKFAAYLVKGTGKAMSACDRCQASLLRDGYPPQYPVPGCDVCKARHLIRKHKMAWPKTHRAMKLLSDFAQKHGYLPLMQPARFRHFRSSGRFVSYYTAFNAAVQGGVADTMKQWMLESEAPLAAVGAWMVLQVHDSLWVMSPSGSGEQVADVLQGTLDAVNPWRARLTIDSKRLA